MISLYEFKDFSLRSFIANQDEEALYEALGHPDVVHHMASSGISRNDCDAIVSETIEHWQKYGLGSWAVEKDSCMIGWAGFKVWNENEIELLIVLGKESWGLGKSIYNELISLARYEFKLDSLVVILPETRKSFQYIVKKAGFKHVGAESYNGESFQKFTLSLDKNA